MSLLTNKRVIVTGASRGIGRAIAIACAREGARVGIGFHRSEPAAREVAEQIAALCTKAPSFIDCDLQEMTELK